MSATDLAAVIIAVAALVTAGTLVWLVTDLRRTADDLRGALEGVQTHVADSLSRLDEQADAVDDELRRVGGLLDSAERVSARADTLSRVTYGAVAKPVIKTAAVVKGTSKAARRLARGAERDATDPAAGASRRTG